MRTRHEFEPFECASPYSRRTSPLHPCSHPIETSVSLAPGSHPLPRGTAAQPGVFLNRTHARKPPRRETPRTRRHESFNWKSADIRQEQTRERIPRDPTVVAPLRSPRYCPCSAVSTLATLSPTFCRPDVRPFDGGGRSLTCTSHPHCVPVRDSLESRLWAGLATHVSIRGESSLH